MDSWNFILAFNIVIIGVAGVLFGMDKALYWIRFLHGADHPFALLLGDDRIYYLPLPMLIGIDDINLYILRL